MTILVEFRIATARFELGQHIAHHENLVAELERVVPTNDYVIPYVWVTGSQDTLDTLTATFEESDAISTFTVLDRLTVNGAEKQQHLYQIKWILDELDLIQGLVEAEGVIMDGESIDNQWMLRFRFPDHGHVAQFYQYLADNDITEFSIHSIHELETRSERGQQYNLTAEQREAITLAAEQGYFETPHEATLEELGDDLGVSEQAVSQRIRRANKKILYAALNQPDRGR